MTSQKSENKSAKIPQNEVKMLINLVGLCSQFPEDA